ncbi:acetyltransferase [Pseudomonas sp. 10B1]|uniref:acetyltransferase n=1 Tax=unclassified Pseudomonas TaxID=196821 RepID=UPI002B2388D8|nr:MULTISPECIES: acetyltransferase [unclassified Pseudomonas]MEA9997375.1 acetyltransferase [Pseudomonas sp. AA4]MEB0089397.1 acetyltransferase [Pseudomonas sp. RTI1]MEB0128551.1 acetyltransferase [Pseudomonas sp. CCC1.2]MEB0155837.1 acetyltransferase [Pseudomonas sp. CCC4.3]MEB0222011.1 acetyltransferase [Pseudomonas sp. AB12(2023)]
MNRLAILGASGHGKVVADTAESCGWQSVIFFDDAWPSLTRNGPWPVAGNTYDLIRKLKDYDGVIVAIGSNPIRLAKVHELLSVGAPLISLLHPTSTVSRHVSIGKGSVVLAGAVINIDTRVGVGAIINTACSIDHDCILADGVHVSPGARLAGGVKVAELSWIGIGASIRQLINVGARVTVGAGAVVVHDIPDDVTAIGVPARALGSV